MNQKKELLMKINLSLCIHCGACSYICSTGTISNIDGDPFINNLDLCNYCCDCEEICPSGAISIPFTINQQKPAVKNLRVEHNNQI